MNERAIDQVAVIGSAQQGSNSFGPRILIEPSQIQSLKLRGEASREYRCNLGLEEGASYKSSYEISCILYL